MIRVHKVQTLLSKLRNLYWNQVCPWKLKVSVKREREMTSWTRMKQATSGNRVTWKIPNSTQALIINDGSRVRGRGEQTLTEKFLGVRHCFSAQPSPCSTATRSGMTDTWVHIVTGGGKCRVKWKTIYENTIHHFFCTHAHKIKQHHL